MFIYKITNKINNKVYIGQTTKTVRERWLRHMSDAISGRLDTKFACAIRKYGVENFSVETIDTAESKEELDQKEIYWIHFYDSIKTGYNSVEGGGDTNTYQYKTDEEMEVIKEKIRQTKIGGKNPNATKIKAKNVLTGEELVFDSCAECQSYFNETQHNFITRRISHQTKFVYQGAWIFSYFDQPYITDYTFEKNNARKHKTLVIDLTSGEQQEFSSFTNVEKFYRFTKGVISKKFNSKGKEFIIDNYKIIVLS